MLLLFLRYSFGSDDLSKTDQVRNSGELDDNGKFVSIDVEELIERIYVAPKAQDLFKDAVKLVVEKYGVKKAVVKSELYTLT